MSRTLCTACQERLEEYFAPATSASSLSLSSYIHKAEDCSLREFVETGDNDRHVNASMESSVEKEARLILDQWNDTESPGILWAAARVADISESLSLQASAPQPIIEQPVLPYKIAFCQAGSIWTDSPVWEHHNTSSVGALLPTISKWLKDCYSSVDHHTCHDKPPSKKCQLPSRVIDVGPSNGSKAPYLLESNGSYGSYVVLSHRWGNYQPFVTNSETLEQNLQYISLLSLPKTFRDAIYITRGLGIRYLWIDSLCILQGNALDWESESANMIRVYQNATLALAATAAIDSRQGCSFKRQASSLNLRINKFPDPSTIYVRKVPTENTLRQSILEAPLNQRAWVLQELLLSSRVIHFAQDQMYWQCSSRLASEDGLLDCGLVNNTVLGGKEKHSSGDLWRQSRIFGLVGNLTSKIDWWDVEISRDYWWTIVEEYSRRSLTHRRDRLPALAGLTEFFRIRTGDSPLAGLWQEDLLFGLMWQVREPVESSLSSDIPSWSWASIEGPVERCPVQKMILPGATSFRNHRYVAYRTKVKACTIKWAGVPLVSRITKGELVFSGRSTRVYISISWCDESASTPSSTSLSAIDQDTAQWYYSGLKRPCLLFADAPCSQPVGLAGFDYTSSSYLKCHIECLIISFSSPFKDSSLGNSTSDASFHEVLLLETCPDWPFHRRIGAGIIFGDSDAFDGELIQDFRII